MLKDDGGLRSGLRWIGFGERDTRLRASWRILLAAPLLPLVALLAGQLQLVLGVPGMIPGGPVQGALFLVILLVWAAVVDRRPLTDYGVRATGRWLADLAAAFSAVLGVWVGWHLLAQALGWFTLNAGPALHGEGVAPVVGVVVSLAINTWVQDVAFFGIVLAVAAQGFHARGLARGRAVVVGWLVGILFFTGIHGTPTIVDAASTALGGAVFGLLYVHTGELAATIGVHWGSSLAAGTVFAAPDSARAVVHVTGSVPNVDAMAPALFLYPVTYLLLVGWIRVSRGDVGVQASIAEWTRRDGGLLGTAGG